MTICNECPAKEFQKQLSEIATKIIDLEARQRLEYQQAHEDFNDLFARLDSLDRQLEEESNE